MEELGMHLGKRTTTEEEFHTCEHVVRIDNSSSLKTWAWEQESNPEPGILWAARPVDHRTTRPHFSGNEPPQADIKRIDPCSKKR
ncbi:hypothetical protein DSO57_1032798 [Entomophthora muscae]|uniref:Uncharacterized protein n=1 Tax=Entomophthora muscae TaxID=34485 RepID=A0ACC2TLZ7_9FUNG|nr:hypothetical protein DSO57_1032798 [Entomophthora muscae]